jgi:hypothetical protein
MSLLIPTVPCDIDPPPRAKRNFWKKRALKAEADVRDLRMRLGRAVSLTVLFGVAAAASLLYTFTR